MSAEGLSTASGSLTADEMKRLDEMRRSLRLEEEGFPPDLPPKARDYTSNHPSGITADYRNLKPIR